MVKLSRAELSKLSVLVNNRLYESKQLMNNEDATQFERCLAAYDNEWMGQLVEKLSDIIYSDAKRVEIVH